MADARQHEPKLAALRAYADGALRPAARERLERHLAQCQTCGEALRGLRRYRTLAGSLGDDVPAIDWARIDSALRFEATRVKRRRQARTLVWAGAALAAAAWLAIAFQARAPLATREAQPPAPPEHVQRPPAPVPQLRATVTAIVGSARTVDSAGGDAALTLESLPLEGWALETGAGSEVHVAIAETGAFVLRESSRLELRVLRPDQVELALAHGSVVSQVLPRRAGERYDVLANARRVRVHGTRFGVESAPESLAVQVDEGVVQVLDSTGALLAELRAPQRWVQDAGLAGRVRRATERLPHPRLLGLDAATWPALVVPTWPSVVQWQIDGTDAAASDQLQMRVPPGKVHVVGRLSDGRSMRGDVAVDAVGARFDPSALRLVPSGTAGAPAPAPTESLDSDSASAVIRASQPALQRCYERSMRGQAPGAASIVRVRLRIEIDARGGVRAVNLAEGEAAPADLAACVRQVARGWSFSPPGGTGVTFEAPLRFRPLH